MCRSKAEGGQRCFGHALASYEKSRDKAFAGHGLEPYQQFRDAEAAARRVTRDVVETRAQAVEWMPDTDHIETLNQSRIALASTEQGRALIDSWRTATSGPDRASLEQMWGKNQDAINDYLDRVQQHGKDLAEKNEKMRRLQSPRHLVTRFRARAASLAKVFQEEWQSAGPALGTAAYSIFQGVRADSTWGTSVGVGAGVLLLGVTAYTAWQQSSSAKVVAEELDSAYRQRIKADEVREKATVQAVYDRDVRQGKVSPSEEAKVRFRDRLREVKATISAA